MRRRAFNTGMLGLLLGGAMPAARAAGAAPAAGGVAAAPAIAATPKTFVLVHGAWYGGWCWDKVARMLRAQGHSVSTPTCPGVGEQAHLLSAQLNLSTYITSICNHLEYENLNEVILVGSGFAGVVISGVADRLPQRINSLVYVDAMVLESGLSIFEAQPAAVTRKRLEQVAAEGKGIAIPPPPLASYGVGDRATLDWLGARLTPQPVATYQEKLVLRHPLGNGRPRIYVDCVAQPFEPLVEIKKKLKTQPGWTWMALASQHDPMISEPRLLADLLGGLALALQGS
ncbi:alpha/beta fold hydrolase [Oxalobacteraceae bacterium]|nr:alpha/beta fold hydrolase [Oxalobacteraceae bacterium]